MSGGDSNTNFKSQVSNLYELIYIYNCNDTYYLTSDTLINSAIIQGSSTFFYHILTLSACDFNDVYGPFAYLRCDLNNNRVGHLYLNVDPVALSHIIKYIQTNYIDGPEIYKNNIEDIEHIIYLAHLMELPQLAERMNALYPTDSDTDLFIGGMKTCMLTLLSSWEMINNKYNISTDLQLPKNYHSVLLEFFDQNKDILKQWYKKIHHRSILPAQYQFMVRLLMKLITVRMCETLYGGL